MQILQNIAPIKSYSLLKVTPVFNKNKVKRPLHLSKIQKFFYNYILILHV